MKMITYIICIALAVITLANSIGIGAYFAYSRWYLKKDVNRIKFGICTQWNCIYLNCAQITI